ncbi:MAG: alpha/beta hydrolase [Actinomycetaceae bacterium]
MPFVTGTDAVPVVPVVPLHPALARLQADQWAAGKRPPQEIGHEAARAGMLAAARAAPPGDDLSRVEDLAAPGPRGDIPVRVYSPDDARATIVYLHGGGWVIGGLDEFDRVARRLARVARARVVSVDYRRAPEHVYPAAHDDAQAALDWVRTSYADLPIVVAGDSAGGNLAAFLAHAARDAGEPLAGQVLAYPVTDHDPSRVSHQQFAGGTYRLTAAAMAWFWDRYVPHVDRRTEPRVAPIRARGLGGLAPAIVVVAGHDPLRDEVLAYAAALAAAGTPVSVRAYPAMEHAFLSSIGVVEDASRVYEDVAADLDELLGG